MDNRQRGDRFADATNTASSKKRKSDACCAQLRQGDLRTVGKVLLYVLIQKDMNGQKNPRGQSRIAHRIGDDESPDT